MQNIQSMESVILANLLRNKEYFGKAYRFLKANHFSSPEYQTIFTYIVNYYKQYEEKPTIKEIGLKLKNETNITENLKEVKSSHIKEMALYEAKLTIAKDYAKDLAKTIKNKPTIIIARTIKGKGVSFMEGVVGFHGKAPTQEEAQKALKELA